jgi:polysaccharide deacetylase family protein (PEP-CTERM system associated)
MKMINLLTVDVEDWYHDLHPSLWKLCESRVVENTHKILRIIEEHDCSATFFVLGCVAEQFPDLIRQISDKGHEIATHGYLHTPITQRNRVEFEEDLRKSLFILERIVRHKILGHRACRFSINRKTAWAIDVLGKNGLKYDSSIFPAITPDYGVPQCPTHPYFISSSNIEEDNSNGTIMEFPLSVLSIPIFHVNIPVAGGFYLRFLPYWFIKLSLKRINKMGNPAVVFIHPKDLDPQKPRIKELSWHHYYGLADAEKKFAKLLSDFKFTSIKNYIEEYGFHA